MQYPAMDGGSCNQCKTTGVGASFGINAASQHKDIAAEFLNAMSTPDMGKLWLESIYLQTAVKTEGATFSGPHADYFTELMKRQEGASYFFGVPLDYLSGRCKDTFTQVMNSGFPGGLVTVDEAVKMMDEACKAA
jgi:multiple sugar transport system substrate-binding protein